MKLLYKQVLMVGIALGLATTLVACTKKQDANSALQAAQAEAYPELIKLEETATNLQNDFDIFTNEPVKVRLAWAKLQSQADATKLKNGNTHPLAGVARIKISGIDYEDGEILPAIQMTKTALEILSVAKSDYMKEITEGVALLSIMYAQTGEAEKALRLQKQAIVDFQAYFHALSKSEKTRSVIVAKSNIEFAHAQTLLRLGRFDEAIKAQQLSLNTRRENLGEDDPDTIGALYGFAQVLVKGGKLEQAEHYARLAMEKATTTLPENHVSYARSLEMLGIVLSRRGQRLEAVEFLSHALKIKRATVGVENLYFAYGVHNLGNILMNLERYEDAEPLLVDADIGFRANQGENSPFAATALVYAANAAYVLGKYDLAIERLNAAIPRLKYEGDNTDETYVLAHLTLANIYIQKQDLDKARRTLSNISTSVQTGDLNQAHAHAVKEHIRYLQGGQNKENLSAAAQSLKTLILASQYVDETGELSFEIQPTIETILSITTSLDQPELAIEIAELVLSSKMSKASRQSTLRLAANDDKLATYLKTLQDAQANFAQLDKDLLHARSKNKGVAEAATAFDEAKINVDLARAQLTKSFPRWAELKPDANISVKDIQNKLSTNEVLIGIIPAFSKVFSVVITKEGARIIQLGSNRSALEALVQRLRKSVQSDKFDVSSARQLYAILLPESAQSLLAQKDHYRIVTSGAFTTLPLSVLIINENGYAPEWLVERAATSVEPSLNIKAHSPKTQNASIKFLGIGAPKPFPKEETDQLLGAFKTVKATGNISMFFRGSGLNYKALADLPELPGAASEIKDISKILATGNSRLLIGKKASEKALSELNLADYSVIAFAAHALVAGEMDGIAEPAMVLSPPKTASSKFDGLLKASEIARFNLKADWVILSACNTAAGDGANGSGYSGLTRAFLYAGADSLLVSHWPVRDDAASILTVSTVQNTQAGMSKAKALQKAMLDLMNNEDIQGAAHPSVWAPFVLVGN